MTTSMNDDNFKILGNKSFEEMNLPPILYKYRDWENDFHKRILTHNELFLASPASFEDEFDCKVPIRYDLLTDKEIYDKYYNSSKTENPHFNRQQHRQFARNWQKKRLLRDKKRLEEHDKEFFEKFNRLFGVLSLTAIPDNYDMWDYYANHCTGFCVGFHTIPLFNLSQYFGGGGEVSYHDTLPIIKETDDLEKKHFLQIHSKLKKWGFENKYRLTKFNVLNRQITIPTNIYAEIILGAKMSDKSRNEIITIINSLFPQLKILKTELMNSTVSIFEF